MNNLYKFISSFISLVLILILFPTSILAESQSIEIWTIDNWNELAVDCINENYSSNLTIELKVNLDFSDTDFNPIPIMAGIFNGNNHTLTGINLTKDTSVNGVFRVISQTGKIHNLYVTGTFDTNDNGVDIGGISGINNGEINNCIFTGNITGNKNIGGITGSNNVSGIINNCFASGTILGQHSAGGICGSNNGIITDCTNSSNINTSYRVIENASLGQSNLLSEETWIDITDIGGIAGLSSGTLITCTNFGAIGYRHVGYNVGGIIGRLSGSASNCINYGKVLGRNDVGGIAGKLEPYGQWNVTASYVEQISQNMDKLQNSLNILLTNTELFSENIHSDIQILSEDIQNTEESINKLTDNAQTFIDHNINSVNDVSERISIIIDGIDNIMPDLTQFSNYLTLSLVSFEESLNHFSKWSTTIDSGIDDFDNGMNSINRSLNNLNAAMNNINNALQHIQDSVEDPIAVQQALKELSDALKDFSEAIKEITTGLDLITQNISGTATNLEQIKTLVDNLNTFISGYSSYIDDTTNALSRIADSMDIIVNNTDLTQIGYAIDDLNSSIKDLQSASVNISNAIDYFNSALIIFDNAQPEFNNAINSLSSGINYLSTATAIFKNISISLTDTIDTINAMDTIKFYTLGNDFIDIRKEVLDNLTLINNDITKLSDDINKASLNESIQNTLDNLFNITDLIEKMFKGLDSTENKNYINDISDSDPEGHSNGIITYSHNNGSIEGDTNVGGIAGSIMLDFDYNRENSTDLSSILSGNSFFLVYAYIGNCSNNGIVTCIKNYAGGVTGYAQYGLIIDSESASSVISDEEYAGGIAGYACATIRNCDTHVTLDSTKYAGGIVGYGQNVINCRSIAHFKEIHSYYGSITGYSNGTIINCIYYSEDKIGGNNGIDYSGECRYVSYEELSDSTPYTELFKYVTVSFVSDTETIEVIIPYGDTVQELPTIPSNEDKSWIWDDIPDSITYDITINGKYQRPVKVLSSGEDKPKVLVQGDFKRTDTLLIEDFYSNQIPVNLLEVVNWQAKTLTVPDYENDLTVRLLVSDRIGLLYIEQDDGTLAEQEYTKFGSYVVFNLKNGGSFIYIEQNKSYTALFIALGVAGLLSAVTTFFLIRRYKIKQKQKQSITVNNN